MASLVLRARGDAPADVAWSRYAEPARWPDWAPQITAVDTDAARIVPGAGGTVIGPLGVRVRFVIDAVDESARSWRWTVRLGPIRVSLAHRVSARGAGSATSLRLRGPAPVLLAYAPVALLALRRLVSRDRSALR